MAGTGFQGLTTGLGQGSNVGPGVYGERLKAFQENLSEREVLSDDSYLNQALAEEKKTEDFMTAARMGEVSPSNANMYEAHYSLVKDMAEQLYSEETLDYFSQSDEGMAKWSKMVDELKQRVDIYEQIYEDSYGDINKADGTGASYSDQVFRKRQGGSAQFFDASGVSIDKSDEDFDEILKKYDQKQHKDLTLDLEAASFNWTSGNDDVFDISDPAKASQIFSYNMMQSRFEAPSDQAAKAPLKSAFDAGEEDFNSKFNTYYGRGYVPSTQLDRAAADYYINQNNLDFTVQDVINGTNPTASFDMDNAREEYRAAVYEILENQKKEEEKEKSRQRAAQRRTTTTTTTKKDDKVEMPLSYPQNFQYNNQQIKGQFYDVAGKKIKITNIDQEVDLKDIIRDENGVLYARFEQDRFLEILPLEGSNLNPNEVIAKINEKYNDGVTLNILGIGSTESTGGTMAQYNQQ